MTAVDNPPRRRALSWIPAALAIAFLLAGLGFAGYRAVHALAQPSAATRAARGVRSAAMEEALAPHVQYAVTGTSKQASMVIVTPAGPQTLEHAAIPLVTKSGLPYLEFTVKHGDPVGLSVRADDGGTVTCTVSVGSTVVATKTSPGPGQPAVCEGTAP